MIIISRLDISEGQMDRISAYEK